MRTDCVRTPEGVVVRRIWATGELAVQMTMRTLDEQRECSEDANCTNQHSGAEDK